MAAPSEDRRLKALGLVLLALAAVAVYWLSEHHPLSWRGGGKDLWLFLAVAALAANLGGAGWIALSAGFGRPRPLRDSRERRAFALYLLAANVVLPALVYSLLADEPVTAERLAQSGWEVPLAALAWVCAGLGFAVMRRGRRQEATSADEAMALDPRPPVLYLRSFQDDDEVALNEYGFRFLRRILRWLVWATPEQELATLLDRVGPVIAIGKPGEELPELGAARLYVSHAQWQDAVAALMRRAALVVVRVGASPGVLWEIEQALRTLPRQRLLFVLLGEGPLAPPIAERLAPVLGNVLSLATPAAKRSIVKAMFWPDPMRRLGAVVCFAHGGVAQVEPVRLWPLGWSDAAVTMMLRPSAGALRYALRRVFGHLNLAWNDARRSRALAIGLAFMLGGFGAHWFYLGQRRRGWAYLVFVWLAVPMLLAWIDALRMVWMERAEFDRQYTAPPPSVATA